MTSNHPYPARRLLVLAALAIFVVLAATLSFPSRACAQTYATASAKAKNTVVTLTAQEKKAYDRAVAACMNYANEPNPIVVDISDFGLTRKQASHVWDMIHSNGELFWVNCYGDTFTKKTLKLPCYYDDATIDKMRKRLDVWANKALKRIGPAMSAATKVHMLHDYVLDRIDYESKSKNAYEGLVKGYADCFGFTLSMDVLLRRCGLETDVAFNKTLDHAWNLVKVGASWYHIDATWDNGYCGINYDGNFNWSKRRCHLYLLQSDASMNAVTTDPATGKWVKAHSGWTCHHACTSTKFDFSRDLNQGFYRHCSDYKSIVRSFKSGGLNYEVLSAHGVRVSSVASKAVRSAKTVIVPASVTYKGVSYNVTGIAQKAFSASSAVKLRIETSKFAKARVRGCLVDSQVRHVKLAGAAKKKAAAYAKCFSAANCGVSVTLS